MGSVPILRAFTAGEYETAAYLNTLPNAISWLQGGIVNGRPTCVIYQTTVQSIPTGTATALLMDSEFVDTDSAHSTSANTSRITPQTPGTYVFLGTYNSAGTAATGVRQTWVQKNGTGAGILTGSYATGNAASAGETSLMCWGFGSFNGTSDYVELMGYHTYSSALNTGTNRTGSGLASFWWSR